MAGREVNNKTQGGDRGALGVPSETREKTQGEPSNNRRQEQPERNDLTQSSR